MLLGPIIDRLLRLALPGVEDDDASENQVLNGAYSIDPTDLNGKLGSADQSVIRSILHDFLQDANLVYPNVTYDQEFAESCNKFAIKQGCSADIVQSEPFQTALQVGVSIATTAYGHLDNLVTRQFICLYTTCLTFVGDQTRTDASFVREFHARFDTDRAQQHPLLDLLAGLLRKATDHLLPRCANLLVLSSLHCMTGFVVDHDLRRMKANENATSHPQWVRTMMAIPTAFVLFTFPPDIPPVSYAQIIPDMARYIDNVNDLFLLYKEEWEHETSHISLFMQTSRKPDLQCMKEPATCAVDASRRCRAMLSSDPKALKAFEAFLQGYIGFQALAHQFEAGDLGIGSAGFRFWPRRIGEHVS